MSKEFNRERSQIIIERKDVESLAKSKTKISGRYIILYLIGLISFGAGFVRIMTFGITLFDAIILLLGFAIVLYSIKRIYHIKNQFIENYMKYFDEKGELQPDIDRITKQ